MNDPAQDRSEGQDPKPSQPFSAASASGPVTGTGSAGAEQSPVHVEVYGERPPARAMLGYIKPTLWVIAAVYVVAFLFLNSDSAQINFVFFRSEVPLFVALLVMLALGMGLGALTVWLRGRHRPEKKSK
ncbi:MAG: LapA family protein [Actinobacteria bacterium]|nr:LapA family protein [Actinomycetota bacterium]